MNQGIFIVEEQSEVEVIKMLCIFYVSLRISKLIGK